MSQEYIQIIEENVRPFTIFYTDYLALPDRELKILLALKSFAWNGKTSCFPSIEKICEIAKKGRRQVIEILQVLEDKELIRIQRNSGTSSIYYITNKLLTDEDSDNNPDDPESYPQAEEPVRKSAEDPCGNPHHTRAEIRTLSNKRKKTKLRECQTTEIRIKKKKSQVPEDFKPNENHYQLAKELGIDADYECTKFIDRNRGGGNLQLDWNRTFNNWLRKAQEYGSKAKPIVNFQTQQMPQSTSAVNKGLCLNDPGHPDYEKRMQEREYWNKKRQEVKEYLKKENNLRDNSQNINKNPIGGNINDYYAF